MAAPPVATVQDVATRLGRDVTDPAEIAQLQAWLADVDTMIRARIPNLDALMAAGAPDASVVRMIEAAAVARKSLNPGGKINERIDDYSYGLSADAARADLWLTDAEWGLLLPGQGTGAFTIRPYGWGYRTYGGVR